MPGNIRVSVLDFLDLPSSSTSSTIHMKASMGRREHHIQGQGDFYIPLSNLRDTMILTFQDDEGNTISYSDVEIKSIVQKGVHDDYIPLEGGGKVHVKLQFILNDEERYRIRMMRESALKKKQSQPLSSSPQRFRTESVAVKTEKIAPKHEISVDIPSDVSSEDLHESCPQPEATSNGDRAKQTAPVQPSVNPRKGQEAETEIREATSFRLEQADLNDIGTTEEPPSTSLVLECPEAHLTKETQLPKAKVFSSAVLPIETASDVAHPSEKTRSFAGDVSSRDIHSVESSTGVKQKEVIPKPEESEAGGPEKKGSLRKTPSSVKKMISAFESNLVQDSGPRDKPSPSKIKMKSPLEDLSKKEVEAENSREQKQSIPVEEFRKPDKNVKKSEEIIALGVVKQPEINISTVETATDSGQVPDLHSGRLQPRKLYMDHEDSCETLNMDAIGRKTRPKEFPKMDSERASNDKLKPASNEAKPYSYEASGTWIFPDDAKPWCTTASGKHAIVAKDGDNIAAETRKGRISSSKNAEKPSLDCRGSSNDFSERKLNSNDFEEHRTEKNQDLRKSKLENSAEVEASEGLVAQAIKVALVMGFGVLVILTRQRKNR